MTKPTAVNRLHAADIRVTVSCQRYVCFGRDAARHARTPEELVPQLLVSKLVYVTDDLQRLPRTSQRRRNEFKQCLGKIGCYVAVGQRGTQASGMWRLCEVTVGSDAQGLFLYASQPTGERCVAASLQGTEALLKYLIHNERFTTSVSCTLYPPAVTGEHAGFRPVRLRSASACVPRMD
jgi:hypothetical protein